MAPIRNKHVATESSRGEVRDEPVHYSHDNKRTSEDLRRQDDREVGRAEWGSMSVSQKR